MTESLGNITKFASGAARNYPDTRFERFYLQAIAREILPDDHRIKICYRHTLPDTASIQAFHSPGAKRGRLSGTMKCGSAWVCPVCNNAITTRRRVELTQAMDNARGKYTPYMLTYTIQHDRNHSLTQSLDAIQAAFRQFRSGRWWQGIKDEFAVRGSVRATEITWSHDNGWHPHYHEILFVDASLSETFGYQAFSTALENHCEPQWLQMLHKQDRTARAGIALTVRFGNRYVAEYVAKFDRLPVKKGNDGLAWEVTASSSKRARREGMSMFDMLYAYDAGHAWAGHVYREFAETVHGRSMLHWSKGTKEMLEIDAVSDAIAAEDQRDDEYLLASISLPDWKLIKRYNAQPDVLSCADRGDAGGIGVIIANLQRKALKSPAERRGRPFCLACGEFYNRHTLATGENVWVCPGCDHET